jgi:competence protein ComEA
MSRTDAPSSPAPPTRPSTGATAGVSVGRQHEGCGKTDRRWNIEGSPEKEPLQRKPMTTSTLNHFAVTACITLATATASGQTLPEGRGKAELQNVCGVCHQAERSAAVRLTREGWEGVIGNMIARGARGTDEEFAAVLDYLSTHFLGDAPRPLNINRATNIELESVAGLTRSEAAALLKWRGEVGTCKSLDELKKVPGLDFKKIEARKDFLVCFEAIPAAPPVKPGADPIKKDKADNQ